MLAGTVQPDVMVAEFREATAEPMGDDLWGVAVRTEMAEHYLAERRVRNFPDEFGDLAI